MTPRVPELGAQVPRSGTPISRALGRCVFALLGWRVQGQLPNLNKFILVAAPHTSNLDAVYGLAGLLAMGFRATIMVKSTAFYGPLGWLLRRLGAIPIDRSSPQGVVEQISEAFRLREAMVLLMTPEGTRKSAREFKSGFHRMAQAAQVPVVPVAFNYAHKAAIVGEPISMQGQLQGDLTVLLNFFRKHGVPRHPERLSLPLRSPAD